MFLLWLNLILKIIYKYYLLLKISFLKEYLIHLIFINHNYQK